MLIRPAAGVCYVAAAGLPAIAGMYGDLASGAPLVGTLGYSLLACGFAALLVLIIAPGSLPVGRLFEARVLRFFGRYSYALYVFHHPLLFLKPDAVSFDRLPTLFGSKLPGWLLFCALGTATSLALALLSWRLLEKPLLGLRDYFPYGAAAGRETAPSRPPPMDAEIAVIGPPPEPSRPG